MLHLKQSGLTYHLESYRVVFDKDYTLENFIDAVLTKKRSWGIISISNDALSLHDRPIVSYINGNIVNLMIIPKNMYNYKVKSAMAYRKRTRIDYELVLEKEEKKDENK